jgi:hypothetical protein
MLDCQFRFWWYPHQVGCGYNRHLHGIYAVAQEIGGSKFRWKHSRKSSCSVFVVNMCWLYSTSISISISYNIHIHIYIYVCMYLITQASIDFSWFDILHLYDTLIFRPVGNVFLSASGRARSAALAESTAMGQPASCGIEHRRLTQRKWRFNGDLTENMVIHWDMFMRFNGFRSTPRLPGNFDRTFEWTIHQRQSGWNRQYRKATRNDECRSVREEHEFLYL